MFQPIEIFGPQLHADRPSGPGESRKLTLSDLFVLTAGFAIALVLPTVVVGFGGGLFLLGSIPIWFLVALSILRLILWLNFAITCVIFVRRVRYGGMPRPAEWLSILLTLWTLQQMFSNLDQILTGEYRVVGSFEDFATARWRIAGVSSLVIVIGLLVFALFQRRLPAWLRILVLSFLAIVLLWGPLTVLELQFASLFPPLTSLGDGWLSWLTVATLQGIAKLPLALLIGIPAIATYFTWRRGGRRTWAWTDRLATWIACLLGICALFFYYFGSYESPATGWQSARIVTTIGFVITGFVSAWLLRYSSVRSIGREGEVTPEA